MMVSPGRRRDAALGRAQRAQWEWGPVVQRRERKRGCGSHRTPGLGYTGASLELGLRKLGSEVRTGVLFAEFPFQTSEAKRNTLDTTCVSSFCSVGETGRLLSGRPQVPLGPEHLPLQRGGLRASGGEPSFGGGAPVGPAHQLRSRPPATPPTAGLLLPAYLPSLLQDSLPPPPAAPTFLPVPTSWHHQTCQNHLFVKSVSLLLLMNPFIIPEP